VRAGAQALSLLAVPLNAGVLTALAAEPTPLVDLRLAVGSPPQTTMRAHLRTLVELGVVERRRRDAFPGAVDYEITTSGCDLVAVAEVVEAWLRQAPREPISLGSSPAKRSIKALVDGWSATIVRALAARPLSLTELNRLVAAHNYPAIERRLAAMRLAGQIESVPVSGRGKPYFVTEWLRRAVAPLAAAARWERKHGSPQVASVSRLDVEAYFLLAVPLLRLPAGLGGSCRLLVELRRSGAEHDLVGALVEIRDGEVASCVSRLRGDADGWAVGSVSTWLRALAGEEAERLELGGDQLVSSVVDGFRGSLARAIS
jgi:DNA-binding HxlR family transcriptional regulator